MIGKSARAASLLTAFTLLALVGPFAAGVIPLVFFVEPFSGHPIPTFGLIVGGPLLLIALVLWLPQLPHKGLVIIIGSLLGGVVGFSSVMGDFVPYLAGWGGHSLETLGGDTFDWRGWLAHFIPTWITFGVFIGFACAVAASVLYLIAILVADGIAASRSRHP